MLLLLLMMMMTMMMMMMIRTHVMYLVGWLNLLKRLFNQSATKHNLKPLIYLSICECICYLSWLKLS